MTSGEGGAIVTDNKNLFEKLRKIEIMVCYMVMIREFWLNLRLPEINAANSKDTDEKSK